MTNNQTFTNLKQYGFKDYYFITYNGNVYNERTKCFVKANRNNYKLMSSNGKKRSISKRKLYRMVYKKQLCIDNITNLESEEWCQIDANYYVSNYGRVKSLKGFQAKILKSQPNSKGYQRVSINGKYIFVHRLVAQCFVKNDNLDEKKIIHHIDSNKTNNRASNLMWVSYSQNTKLYYESKSK